MRALRENIPPIRTPEIFWKFLRKYESFDGSNHSETLEAAIVIRQQVILYFLLFFQNNILGL